MIVTPVSTFPLDGLQTASARFNAQAEAISRGQNEAEDQVAMLESERAIEANVTAARAADKMVGTMLDTVA